MATASSCRHPRDGQQCLHTQSDSIQDGSYSGHTFFLACAWEQNKQAMQVYVSPEEKHLLPHGTARTAITLKRYVIPLKLSKIHTVYRMRRWELTLWWQGSSARLLRPCPGPGLPWHTQQGTDYNQFHPSPSRSPRRIVASGLVRGMLQLRVMQKSMEMFKGVKKLKKYGLIYEFYLLICSFI